MRHILSPSGRMALQQLAHREALIAFDYDGTLAPIVDDPAQAHPRPTTARLVAEVTRLYPSALITGRSLADVERFLGGARWHTVVGNHGAEAAHVRDRSHATASWVAALADRLPEGVRLEDKRYSIALHYRGVADQEGTRERLVELVATLPGARLLGGKCVVNAVPADAPTKGDAVAKIWSTVGAETVLYVGDDETDEDVFGAAYNDAIVGVCVEPREGSLAAYYLDDQRQIDDLLGELIALRRGRMAATPSP